MNLATQSSASSADEIRESGRAFQSLIVLGKRLPLKKSVLAMGVWNAVEFWFLARLVLGIRSSVGTLALPSRPLYSNMSIVFPAFPEGFPFQLSKNVTFKTTKLYSASKRLAGTSFVLLKATYSPNPNPRSSGPGLAGHLVLPPFKFTWLNILLQYYNNNYIYSCIHTYKHSGFTLLKSLHSTVLLR